MNRRNSTAVVLHMYIKNLFVRITCQNMFSFESTE